jgi:hypothetical protein
MLACLAMAVAGRSVRADEGCIDFKWDVTHERALFAGTPVVLTAGKDSKSAPSVAANRLYKLELSPQEQVAFAVPPGRKSAGQSMFAGIAKLRVPALGSYRFSIDLPIWIDVAVNGKLLPAQDFQGQRACSAPHKIVEFDLPGGGPLILQLSNASIGEVLLAITPTPARTL